MSQTPARKIVLLTPVSDWTWIKPFVETCLRDGVTLVAIAGEAAEEVEDLVDDALLDSEAEPGAFVTTAHPDETLEEAIAFAADWPDPPGPPTVVRL